MLWARPDAEVYDRTAAPFRKIMKIEPMNEKDMEDVKVYRSIRGNAPTILGCFLFASIGGIFFYQKNECFMAALALFFFGGGGTFLLFLLIWERVLKRPYLVISEKTVRVNGLRKVLEIRFSDVDAFSFVSKWMIGVRYKDDVELRKIEKSSRLYDSILKWNKQQYGSLEYISADGLTLTPQELYELLNGRLALHEFFARGARELEHSSASRVGHSIQK